MFALTKVEWSVIAGLVILCFGVKRASAATPATGEVDVGVPFVQGPGAERFGQTDYGTEPVETDIQRLIRESNQLGSTVVRDGQVGLASTDDLL